MNKPICTPAECTACNVCANVCPQHCIRIHSDKTELCAFKDEGICIDCGLCEKVCPILNEPYGSEPQKAYAAWAKDPERRRNSASGGIAAEIYSYGLSQGWRIAGVDFNDTFDAVYKLSADAKDIALFQNSKYVYSTPADIYSQIRAFAGGGGVSFLSDCRAMWRLLHPLRKNINSEINCTLWIWPVMERRLPFYSNNISKSYRTN